MTTNNQEELDPDPMVESRTPSASSALFEDLFEREFAYVRRVLRRLGVQEADVDDVTQETFISVHRKLAEFRTDAPARPWLFSFSFRAAANYRRLARHRRETTLDEQNSHADHRSPEDQTAAAQDRTRVLAGLQTLDFDQRAVFVMHDIEGFSAPEIATLVEAPLNTVYSRLRLARASFRRAVLQDGSDDDRGGRP